MKKQFLLAALLLAASGGASAQWIKFQSRDDSTLYVDPATARASGDLRTVWFLVDYKTARSVNGQAALSDRTQIEYDCRQEWLRIRSVLAYDRPMGDGRVVASDEAAGRWQSVAPKTLQQSMWRIVCR